jgi:dTMP kinase
LSPPNQHPTLGGSQSSDLLIAIEGVDGCGKSTQVDLLAQALEGAGYRTLCVSFPRYGDPVFGDLIKRFLRGELGEVDAVNPRLVALLFAGDRGAEAPSLRQALLEDRVVICDRYFYSNLAYQAAKLRDELEAADFVQWLRKLEFGHYAVPTPACSIYLDVHQDDRRERLIQRTLESSASNGAIPDDIHERDVSLQARVEEVFRSYAEIYDDLVRIDCQQYDRRLNADEVHARIMRMLAARQLISVSAESLPARI